MQPQDLKQRVEWELLFGKYKGRVRADLPSQPDERTVFSKLRELRNKW